MKNPRNLNNTRHALWSAMIILFCNGLLYATWGVSIPIIKEKFDLSEALLSMAMAAVAIGGVATITYTSKLIVKYGSGRASVASGALMALMAAVILLMPNYTVLLVLLSFYGTFAATNDVAVNSQGAYLESISQRSMIGALHASFSAGGLTGSLIASLWAGSAWPAAANFYVLAIAVCMLMFLAARHLKNESHGQTAQNESIRRPLEVPRMSNLVHRRLLTFGILAFSVQFVEGAFYDWAAVYMREVVGAPASWVGLGYAAFSIGMVGGRLGGDRARDRLSHQSVVIISWSVSMLGLAAILISSMKTIVVFGFFVIGIGMSNMIPLLFSSAGKLSTNAGIPASHGLAVTTRISYLGVLVGPLLIGPVAHLIGLKLSLLSLAAGITASCTGWLVLSQWSEGTPWMLPSQSDTETVRAQQDLV